MGCVDMDANNEISPETLSRWIGRPNAPQIIDLRIDEDFEPNPRLIPTAFRCRYRDIEDLIPQLGSGRVVLICHKGLKISHGAAALLRSHGLDAVVLAGGFAAWCAHDLPKLPADKLPTPGRGSLWVTEELIEPQRLASAWLIRRFVDPRSRFLFVPASETINVAEKFDAFPLKNDPTQFEELHTRFDLRTPALEKLAGLADCSEEIEELPGLSMMSFGLSKLAQTDTDRLKNGLLFWDALYRHAQIETEDKEVAG